MTAITGVAENLKGLAPADDLSRILIDRAGGPDRHGRYERPNGDTMVLPCKRHMYWAQKGFTLVELMQA